VWGGGGGGSEREGGWFCGRGGRGKGGGMMRGRGRKEAKEAKSSFGGELRATCLSLSLCLSLFLSFSLFLSRAHLDQAHAAVPCDGEALVVAESVVVVL
jgi:hypothetical protein